MIDFKNFDEWTEEKIHPVVIHSVLILIAVFISFAIFEYVLDGRTASFSRSIPLRAAAFAALLLMLGSQKVMAPGVKRVVVTLFLGFICQMTMVYVYIFFMGRAEYAPLMILYYFLGILLVAPALEPKFFVGSAVLALLQFLAFMYLAKKDGEAIVYTGFSLSLALLFLGLTASKQRANAMDLWRLARGYYVRSTIDALSQLLNRRSWYERSEAIVNERRASSGGAQPVSFIMLDIDHFKRINDTWGHECGDLVIRGVSGTIVDATREGDMIGRLGGEEFGILLPGATEEIASEIAERIRHRVEALELTYKEHSIRVTVSLGLVGDITGDLDSMVRAGDELLYKAKRSGRNRVMRDEKNG